MPDMRRALETTYQQQRDMLVRLLGLQFTALNEAECEDLVQFAFLRALEQLADPGFSLEHTWAAWLKRVAVNAAISFVRRVEAWSLEALAAGGGDGDGSDQSSLPITDRGMLTPSQILAADERSERRRMLVSDLLRDYVCYVEKNRMWTQREVFERSLRGQDAAGIARDMGLPPQRAYEHRARAFQWIREQVDQRDSRGSVLASVFGGASSERTATASASPRRLTDVVRWAVDQVGALCPSESRLSADGPDVQYHVRAARWYHDDNHGNPKQPGCRHCQEAPGNDQQCVSGSEPDKTRSPF